MNVLNTTFKTSVLRMTKSSVRFSTFPNLGYVDCDLPEDTRLFQILLKSKVYLPQVALMVTIEGKKIIDVQPVDDKYLELWFKSNNSRITES